MPKKSSENHIDSSYCENGPNGSYRKVSKGSKSSLPLRRFESDFIYARPGPQRKSLGLINRLKISFSYVIIPETLHHKSPSREKCSISDSDGIRFSVSFNLSKRQRAVDMNIPAEIEKFPPTKEYLLLILHELQNNSPQNYLSKENLQKVAEYLNTTYSSIYGTAKYYTLFSLEPRGKHVIRLCRSPVCDMLEATPVFDALKEHLGIEVGETTRDGFFTLEHTECLGQCDRSPTMMIGEKVYGPLTPQKAKEIIGRIEEVEKP